MKRQPFTSMLSGALLFLGMAVFFSFSTSATSLDPRLPLSQFGIDTWDGSDGLSQFRIRAVVQTRDGYLWLGTANGLVRFDGVEFDIFDIATGSLKDNEVSCLAEDSGGALWIGTYGGGLVRYEKGVFTSYTDKNGLVDDSIRRMCKDAAGNLWIATPRGIMRLTNGVFTSFTTQDGLPDSFVTGISPRASSGIFVAAGGRLSRFENGRFVPEEGVLEEGDGRIDGMATGNNGELWITFESGLIKCWQDGRLTVYTRREHHRERLGAVYVDSAGSVWFAARDELLRLTDGKFESITANETKSGLGLVLSMCADGEGNLWLGTEANGLARLRSLPARLLTTQNGLPENSTRCVYRDQRGDVWVGTYLGYAKISNGGITAFTRMGSNAIPAVTAFNEDASGRLWLAAGGQLYFHDEENLKPVPGWKKVFDIKAITHDIQGHMWIGTDGGGLFEWADGQVKSYQVKDGLANNQVRAILCDRQGVLWVGTSGGLSRFENGKILNLNQKDGLANDRVMSLCEDAEGVLWISTRAGLSRYQAGKFFNYQVADGLPDSFIYNVLDDRLGNFWISSGKGIHRVSKASLNARFAGTAKKIQVSSVGYREGLRSASLVAGTQPNACVDSDGRLLFCSLKGLVQVNPVAQSVNRRIPPVYIEMVRINQTLQPLDCLPEIAPGDGAVEIHYAGLSFVAPENVHFKYRMEGIDSTWFDAGTRRYAYYANLPPGTYHFQVIACNNDGIWNNVGATYSFHLLPHFYQRIWFWPAIGFFVIGLAAAAFWLRLRRHQQNERELQRRVDEAVARVKVLSGLLPICSGCKKVRDDQGYWNQIERYIMRYSDVSFSHSLCPDCLKRYYPDEAADVLKELQLEKEKRDAKLNPPSSGAT